MINLLLHWLWNAFVIIVVAKLLPDVRVKSFGTALVVALVLGVFNVFLGPVFVFLGTVITLPAVILTLGLFYFVVRFCVNVFLLWLTAALVPGFAIRGTGTLILASILISLASALAEYFTRS